METILKEMDEHSEMRRRFPRRYHCADAVCTQREAQPRGAAIETADLSPVNTPKFALTRFENNAKFCLGLPPRLSSQMSKRMKES